MPAVESQPAIGLIRKQVNAMPHACRRAIEKVGELFQRVARVDAACWIVRRVHDHRRVRGPIAASIASRSRSKVGWLERHLASAPQSRQAAGLVAEPRGLGDDGFVARIEDQVKGHHDRRERAGRERDIRSARRQGPARGRPARREMLRLPLARLVGEPVLVEWLCAFADRSDQPGQRQLMWIAEREIAHVGVEAPLCVARGRIKSIDGHKRCVRRPDAS